MSGRNQHYIPQMVMKSFEIKNHRQKKHIYSYYKQYDVAAKAIKKIACKNSFYSDSIDTSLDDEITKYENTLPNLRKAILDDSNNGSVDSAIAAEYVVHLTLRTASTRSAMSDKAEVLITQTYNGLNSSQKIDEVLHTDGNEIIEKELSKLPKLSPSEKVLIYEYVKNKIHTNGRASSEGLKQNFPEQKELIVVNAHKKAITKSLVPDVKNVKIDKLKKFNWTIITNNDPDPKYILPDCIAICFTNNNTTPFPFIIEDIDGIHTILTPISPYKLMVGSLKNNIDCDLNTFNVYAAQCSNLFFLSSYNSSTLTTLKSKIGEHSQSTIVNEIRHEFAKYSKDTGRNEPCPCQSGKKFKKCCLK